MTFDQRNDQRRGGKKYVSLNCPCFLAGTQLSLAFNPLSVTLNHRGCVSRISLALPTTLKFTHHFHPLFHKPPNPPFWRNDKQYVQGDQRFVCAPVFAQNGAEDDTLVMHYK